MNECISFVNLKVREYEELVKKNGNIIEELIL